MARQLLFSAYQLRAVRARSAVAPTRRSPRSPRKAVKEVAYHRDHADAWMLRLGDGTEESHAPRCRPPRARCGRTSSELFDADALTPGWSASGVAADPRRCAPACDAAVAPCSRGHADRARESSWHAERRPPGVHTEHLATCSPRCSTCTARTRGRPGEPRAASASSRRLGGRRVGADPEIPVLTIADLGILRDVDGDRRRPRRGRRSRRPTPAARRWTRSAPTSSRRCAPPGIADVEVAHRARPGLDHRLDDRRGRGASSPAYGIAPPPPRRDRRGRSAGAARCAARSAARRDTRELSRFGSTACKALWRVHGLPRAVRPLQGDLMRHADLPTPPALPPAARWPRSSRLTEDAVALTLRRARRAARDYRFTPGQHLDARAPSSRRRACAATTRSARRPAGAAAGRRSSGCRAARSRAAPTRSCGPGDELDVMTPDRALLPTLDPAQAAALRRDRRRQRHHAGARRSCATALAVGAAERCTLVYGNRTTGIDDVPRGARRT